MAVKKSSPLILLPIEKGVPIPEAETAPSFRRKATYRIAIERLFVGDSIFIPEAKQPPQHEIVFLKQRFGRNFIYRTVKDEEGNIVGVRVWRVAARPDQIIDPEVKKRNEIEEAKQRKKDESTQGIAPQAVDSEPVELKRELDRGKITIRTCLKCGKPFESESIGDRYHRNCRVSVRNAK